MRVMGFGLRRPNAQDFTVLGELLQTGKITVAIARTYPLDEVPAADRYLMEGHALGKGRGHGLNQPRVGQP
jgi:NADPH:quinone reductase-like Zn-dependent oxidoreductase